MQRITLLIACILAVSFPVAPTADDSVPVDPVPEYSALVESSKVRLVNGIDSCSGRVEIYHAGQWGTVCDYRWDVKDAEVVCKELGCGSAVTAFPAAHFGQGSGPIWLSNLYCFGSESSITQCLHNEFGSHNCGHYEDAGVECSESSKVRLVNGIDSCSGRVEIYHEGQWGTVCDDGWDTEDAEVVCKELGCGSAVTAFPAAHFGEGSGPIWLSNLHCFGSENSITQCLHNGFGSHYCSHYEDAGVECSGPGLHNSLLAASSQPNSLPCYLVGLGVALGLLLIV